MLHCMSVIQIMGDIMLVDRRLSKTEVHFGCHNLESSLSLVGGWFSDNVGKSKIMVL